VLPPLVFPAQRSHHLHFSGACPALSSRPTRNCVPVPSSTPHYIRPEFGLGESSGGKAVVWSRLAISHAGCPCASHYMRARCAYVCVCALLLFSWLARVRFFPRLLPPTSEHSAHERATRIKFLYSSPLCCQACWFDAIVCTVMMIWDAACLIIMQSCCSADRRKFKDEEHASYSNFAVFSLVAKVVFIFTARDVYNLFTFSMFVLHSEWFKVCNAKKGDRIECMRFRLY
jgi:hypothetical protein